MMAVALTIAGSDPSGGAGVQADLKTFHQFGVYGAAVMTLVTVQNTKTFSRLELLPADLVIDQIHAVVADIPPNAAKTGALGSPEIVEAVASMASSFPFPLVVDPVMIGKHGARLLSTEGEQALKDKLLPHASLITPNVPEAEALAGITIQTAEDIREAAKRLLALGCEAVLIKGGHRSGEPNDVLLSAEGFETLKGRRIQTAHTHGTGCTYSAAITAGIASGLPLAESCERAKAYMQRSIEQAPLLGHGRGPVNHFASISEQPDLPYRSKR